MRIVYALMFLASIVYAQEMPPISNFDIKTYGAGNQNWMLSQGADKTIYIANNSGLLVYNGEQWELHKVPDGSAVRSVLALNGKIFTGSYMDIGYWEKGADGTMTYTSLKKFLDGEFLDGEQFWHIKSLGDYVVFQSLRRLYSYNLVDNRITVISPEKTITNLFKVQNKIYYQVDKEGLYAIDDTKTELFIPDEQIGDKIFVGLSTYKDGLLIATRNSGIYTYSEGSLSLLQEYPQDLSVFTSIALKDGKLVLGTIGHGLFIDDLSSRENINIVQPDILNNTVLSILQDDDGNIWCGLDNGLSVINQNSPIKLFTDTFGEIGTVYCSYQLNDKIYLGTNQGLYYRTITGKDSYKMVEGTSGQVWTINAIDSIIYIGHDLGTFKINENIAEQIFSKSGTWEIKPLGNGILQGHYNGITFFNPNKPMEVNYIDGFDLSARNIVVEDRTTVWIGHDHKGIFRLKLNKSDTQVVDVQNYMPPKKNGLGLTVFKFQDSIYYSTTQEVFKYNPSSDSFTSDNELQRIAKDQNRISGITKVLPDGSWWSFGTDQVYYINKDAFQNKLSQKSISLPIEYRSIANNFENISLLGDRTYLIGANIGYSTFTFPYKTTNAGVLYLNSVSVGKKGTNYKKKYIGLEELDLPNDENYIRFKYSLRDYNKLNNVKYSYRVLNYLPTWSSWDESGTTAFKNFPPGSYTFEVRAKSANTLTNTIAYKFTIAKPWYLSGMAIVAYAILFLILLFLVHLLSTNYSRKQRKQLIDRNKRHLEMKQLESQQEIMGLKNNQLEADVASKNRELAASTMNLIKKNEFLTQLKNKLTDVKDKKDIQEVIKIINEDIAKKDNWKLFKEAFDNADRNFLQAVKEKHPNLTSNDLKLCAYLRLNLSSKEIAPLLNISVRSVEIKRYRLRKKMELEHEEGLAEYILSFDALNTTT